MCVCVCVCVCARVMCICVLDHLTTVMRCHVQMITADVFITQPTTVLSCAATESLNDNPSLRHAQEMSHTDGWLLSVVRLMLSNRNVGYL